VTSVNIGTNRVLLRSHNYVEWPEDSAGQYQLVKQGLYDVLMSMERNRDRVGKPLSHRERSEVAQRPGIIKWNELLATRIERVRSDW
jgi:hypothetical protein